MPQKGLPASILILLRRIAEEKNEMSPSGYSTGYGPLGLIPSDWSVPTAENARQRLGDKNWMRYSGTIFNPHLGVNPQTTHQRDPYSWHENISEMRRMAEEEGDDPYPLEGPGPPVEEEWGGHAKYSRDLELAREELAYLLAMNRRAKSPEPPEERYQRAEQTLEETAAVPDPARRGMPGYEDPAWADRLARENTLLAEQDAADRKYQQWLQELFGAPGFAGWNIDARSQTGAWDPKYEGVSWMVPYRTPEYVEPWDPMETDWPPTNKRHLEAVGGGGGGGGGGGVPLLEYLGDHFAELLRNFGAWVRERPPEPYTPSPPNIGPDFGGEHSGMPKMPNQIGPLGIFTPKKYQTAGFEGETFREYLERTGLIRDVENFSMRSGLPS